MSKFVQLTINGEESDALQDILEDEILGDDEEITDSPSE